MFKTIENVIEGGIFASRWLLLPLYVGMVIAQVIFAAVFAIEFWHVVHEVWTHGFHGTGGLTATVLVAVLEMLDIIMVANLVLIVVIGGYATFVSKLDLAGHVDRPAWLDHIDPGTLKTKLAGGLVGVSGIHLLQSFVHMSQPEKVVNTQHVMLQIGIHIIFVIAVLIMAWSDLLVQRKVQMEHELDREDAQGRH
jgi:uncharacterized protein (TIGR00645 family)